MYQEKDLVVIKYNISLCTGLDNNISPSNEIFMFVHVIVFYSYLDLDLLVISVNFVDIR